MMRCLVLFAAAMIPVSAAIAAHSGLTIPRGQDFQLGGDQAAAMNVAGRNVGTVAVAVIARGEKGDAKIADVAPGARFAHVFAVGEAAILRNASATTAAKLSVDFDGTPAALTMRYAPTK